jgi:hypothetical protein
VKTINDVLAALTKEGILYDYTIVPRAGEPGLFDVAVQKSPKKKFIYLRVKADEYDPKAVKVIEERLRDAGRKDL